MFWSPVAVDLPVVLWVDSLSCRGEVPCLFVVNSDGSVHKGSAGVDSQFWRLCWESSCYFGLSLFLFSPKVQQRLLRLLGCVLLWLSLLLSIVVVLAKGCGLWASWSSFSFSRLSVVQMRLGPNPHRTFCRLLGGPRPTAWGELCGLGRPIWLPLIHLYSFVQTHCFNITLVLLK